MRILGHIRDHPLYRLELGNGLAELLALLCVADHVLERARGEADHLRADADAALVQRLNRHLVALADVAQHLSGVHAAILEQELARARRADAELVLFLADRESRCAALDEERRDALVAVGARQTTKTHTRRYGSNRLAGQTATGGRTATVFTFERSAASIR
jgi:hypothetical protein